MSESDNRDDGLLLVHAYLDAELEPAAALALERRMAEDPALRRERARALAVRQLMREHLPASEMPPGLARRVEAALPRAGMPARRWQAMAASLLIGAAVGGAGTWQALRPVGADGAAVAIVDSHIRALMATSPADVMSSDRHTVKPWFNGRLTQSPRVVDLAAAGFPLLGGRVDVVERIAVPTVVYKRREHVISLFALPHELSGGPPPRSRDGFNVVTWDGGETAFWAVSDLNARELAEFGERFRAAN